jgi:hypothetical protein
MQDTGFTPCNFFIIKTAFLLSLLDVTFVPASSHAAGPQYNTRVPEIEPAQMTRSEPKTPFEPTAVHAMAEQRPRRFCTPKLAVEIAPHPASATLNPKSVPFDRMAHPDKTEPCCKRQQHK